LGERPSGYEVRYRDSDGLQRTKGGFRRKRDAEAYAVELEATRHQGVLIPHSHGSVGFDQVADVWLTSIHGRRRPKTIDGYEKLLNLHVRPAFGARRIGSVSYADVDRFVRELEASGRRPGTVRNAFFVVKMVFDYGIRDGRIRNNPCTGVELPSPRSPEMLFLTAAEVRALAAAIDERWLANTRVRKSPGGPPPYNVLVEFAAFTGLRAGEVAALRIGSVDLRRGTVRVARSASTVRGELVEGEPKTKAGRRTISLPGQVVAELVEHMARYSEAGPDGLVFPGPRGGALRASLWRQRFWRPAVTSAGDG